jgi:hypothetical protein
MPLTTATTAWTSVTLAQDEIWQCRGGRLLTTVETPSGDSDDRGIVLTEDSVRVFRNGQTVRYRTLQATGTEAPARLHREQHL